MHKDIRSFFKVIPKKAGTDSGGSSQTATKFKKLAVFSDSDEDIIDETPTKPKAKKEIHLKKRSVTVLSSDSDDDLKEKTKKKENSPTKKLKPDSKEATLKPVNIDDLFNNTPVKQSKVNYVPPKETEKTKTPDKKSSEKSSKNKKKKNTELGVHNDDAFERTLIELDEDDDTILLNNLDIFDKTIEDAEKQMKLGEQNKKEHEKEILKDKDTPKKEEKKRHRRDSNESKATPNKKQKLEHVDSGFDNGEAKWEKKRYSAVLYQKYLQRGGPKHHGQKEIPQGNPHCLQNLTFLKTGVLDSLESEEFDNLIKSHGGRTVHSVSRKVNFIVVGEDPGPAKLEKAKTLHIREINEDELLDMILVKSGMEPKYTIHSEDQGIGSRDHSPDHRTSKEELSKVKEENHKPKHRESSHSKDVVEKPTLKKLDEKDKTTKEMKKEHRQDKVDEKKRREAKIESHKSKDTHKTTDKELEHPLKTKLKEEKTSPHHPKEKVIKKQEPATESISKIKSENIEDPIQTQCWTEKYRPTNLKSVIGQQESNSNMNKLKKWLENWDKNQTPKVRKGLPKPSPWNQFDGAYFKAALLSGPPGVGKTTTATLVAQELGYDVVEFNASDTRSKKMLHTEISQMMNQKSVSGFALGQNNLNQKRVLLMDEVDGMAGNEDRGGIAELINLIKITNFPIICMCNDRSHQKMRTLVTHCYELKFAKPQPNQIKGAMMSICFKEGLKIKPEALADLINGTGCDIRQILNNLAMWSAANKTLTDSTVKTEAAKAHKDVVFGPWDVIRKVFSYNENHKMSIMDKSKLFFYDYSLGPLFVQENYLRSQPRIPSGKSNKEIVKETVRRMCLSAESLAIGDQIESKIRSTNNWALLDSQSYFSTVIPSYYMSGEFKGCEFPSWFGKNSKLNKTKRLISEVHSHTRASTSGDKTSIRLDYCIPLRNAIVQPLKVYGTDGVRKALDVMKTYSLLREDLTNLVELCQGFKNKDTFSEVDAKVKTAFTKAYNKEVLLPFAPASVSKKKKAVVDDSQFLGEENDQDEDGEQDDDSPDKDGLIKVKPAKTTKNSSSKAGSSKTSAKGKKTK